MRLESYTSRTKGYREPRWSSEAEKTERLALGQGPTNSTAAVTIEHLNKV